MKKLLLLFFILLTPLHALEISLEHATTPEQISWGLMGRHSLPSNHGMTFTLPKKTRVSIWMFNCFIDLSVAFLDDKHNIQEIRDLKAYPERMDPVRPVRCLEDLALYPPGDPIRRFFYAKAVTSTTPVKYFVEMPKDWFTNNNVQVGDKIIWKLGSSIGIVKRLASDE